jgi:small subunit ribosomal protein S8
MSQDIVADGLNQIMNVKRARRTEVRIKKYSKLLINLLDLMKKLDYLDYEIEGKEIIVKIKKINEIRSIKPRFNVSVDEIDKYVRRFLPARDFGFIIISTSEGLLTHDQALEKNIGGSLIAYVF